MIILIILNVINIENSYSKEIKSLGFSKSFLEGLYIDIYKKIPQINFYDINNKEINIKNFDSKVIIMTFFPNWSLESGLLLKDFDNIYDYLKFKEIKDIIFLPIAVDFKNSDEIKEFYKKNNINNLNIYIDKKKALLNALQTESIPVTFIVDRKGYIIACIKKYINWANLDLISFLNSVKTYNSEAE